MFSDAIKLDGKRTLSVTQITAYFHVHVLNSTFYFACDFPHLVLLYTQVNQASRCFLSPLVLGAEVSPAHLYYWTNPSIHLILN